MNIRTEGYIYWMQKFTNSSIKSLSNKEMAKITKINTSMGLKKLGYYASWNYVHSRYTENKAAWHNHLAHVPYSADNKTISKWDEWQVREADSYYRYYTKYRYHKYSIVTYEKSATGGYVKINGEYIAYSASKHKGRQRYKKKTTYYQFKTRQLLKKEIKGYVGDKLYFAAAGVWSDSADIIPQPTKFEISYQDYEKDGNSVSRNSNGEVQRHRVQKNLRTINVSFNGLTEEQYRKIFNYISGEFVKVCFYDPMSYSTDMSPISKTTGKFYVDSKSIVAAQNGRWADFSFSLVEAERQNYE